MTYNAITDASNAVKRIQAVFEAESLDDPTISVFTTAVGSDHEKGQQLQRPEFAIKLEGASFVWDSPPPSSDTKGKTEVHAKKGNKAVANDEDKQFCLPPVDLEVPWGKLVAVVGQIGSGKSSLVQGTLDQYQAGIMRQILATSLTILSTGIVGSMRKTEGNIAIGGSLAYCTQTPWIQVR